MRIDVHGDLLPLFVASPRQGPLCFLQTVLFEQVRHVDVHAPETLCQVVEHFDFHSEQLRQIEPVLMQFQQ